jgi:uncharacterized repeat protein (TIGR01451 family)
MRIRFAVVLTFLCALARVPGAPGRGSGTMKAQISRLAVLMLLGIMTALIARDAEAEIVGFSGNANACPQDEAGNVYTAENGCGGLIHSVPDSVRNGATESNAHAITFNETHGHILGQGRNVNIHNDGKYTRESQVTEPPDFFRIPQGSCVDSHFIHADNTTDDAGPPTTTNGRFYRGIVQVDTDILGVVVFAFELGRTEEEGLGRSGVLYPTEANPGPDGGDNGVAPDTINTRDVEFRRFVDPNQEEVTLNKTAGTVGFQFQDFNQTDQLRIISVCKASISLTPASDNNTIGDPCHLVTAIVKVRATPADDNINTSGAIDDLVEGVRVRFTVTGANPQGPVTVVTGSDGKATFCSEGNNPGTDTIRAFVDILNDQVEQPYEPDDTATKTWLVPDVHVTKTPDPGTINATDTARFQIDVSNAGPGRADGVTLNDTLPPGTWSVTGACGTFSAAAAFNCNLGTLQAGENRRVTISRQTDKNECATPTRTLVLTNTATVDASNEPNTGHPPTDNSSAANVTVLCPDVHVAKSGQPSTINAGDNAVFQIDVSNAGPGAAYNVTLNDTLPSGTWSLQGACGSGTATTSFSCSLGTLTANESRRVTISRMTTAADCSTPDRTAVLSDTATVDASNEPDVDHPPTDNQAVATITVLCPDVHVTKTADATPINATDTAGFKIEVSNAGPGAAYGTTLDDTLPPGSWNLGGPDAGACGASPASGTFHCEFGTVASGGVKKVTVSRATTAADCANAARIGTLTDKVKVDASNEANTGHPPSDNEAEATITVLCPDVRVEKTADDPSINATDTAGFSIEVTNDGPGVAYNVTLYDQLPPGVNWAIDSQPPGNPCSIDTAPNPDELRCSFGNLASGEKRTLHISGQTDPPDCETPSRTGTLSNTATVRADNEAAQDNANNSSTAVITVNCPDVHVTKSASVSRIFAARPYSYTITGTNDGPGAAYGVLVTDDLHDALIVHGATFDVDPGTPGGLGVCTIGAGNTIRCEIGTLAASDGDTTGAEPDTVVITINVTGTIFSCGNIINRSHISATNEASQDQDDNDSNEVTVDIDCLTPGKTCGGGKILPDGTVEPALMLITSGSNGGTAWDYAGFNFNVTFTSGDTAPKGHLRYDDRPTIYIHTKMIDRFVVFPAPPGTKPTHAEYTGRAVINGVEKEFYVQVDDLGEGSNAPPDRFRIQILEPLGYVAEGVLTNGNIQVNDEGNCGNDGDSDGFSDVVEEQVGTDPLLACGVDAWPADINNDGVSDITDVVLVGSNFGKAVPPAPARHDVAPDPPDGVVDISDIVRVGSLFGKSCAS